MSDTTNTRRFRQPGDSAPVTQEAMRARIARYAETPADTNAVPDLEHPGHARVVKYMLSPQELAGPAPIDSPHNFHLANMRMPKGVRPAVHAHPYNEVFMPLDGRFRFYFGEGAGKSLENSTILGPMDVISVPGGVHRTFENVGDAPAHVLVIFDISGDPHTDMIIAPEDFDEFYKDGWVPGQEPKKFR
jgi:mannose-6-phosphate isomerase-like protein (cupin superfamily)